MKLSGLTLDTVYFEDYLSFLSPDVIESIRNDYSSDSFAFNDTHIFDLQKLEWQEITLYSDSPYFTVYNRCGHSAIVYCKFFFL